jgi:hypothetical protein
MLLILKDEQPALIEVEVREKIEMCTFFIENQYPTLIFWKRQP